jgi:hypothetical protein
LALCSFSSAGLTRAAVAVLMVSIMPSICSSRRVCFLYSYCCCCCCAEWCSGPLSLYNSATVGFVQYEPQLLVHLHSQRNNAASRKPGLLQQRSCCCVQPAVAVAASPQRITIATPSAAILLLLQLLAHLPPSG